MRLICERALIMGRIVGSALLMLVLLACSNTDTTSNLIEPDTAKPKDGMVLVFFREFSFEPGVDDIDDEQAMLECVGNAILDERPQQPLVPFDEFHRIAFPKLSSESVPRTPKYLSILLKRPDFYDRLRTNGVRYIAFLGGTTQTSQPRGGIWCGGYGHGAGCFGLVRWDKRSRLGASILDLDKVQDQTELRSVADGSSVFGMFIIFPFGVPSNTVGAVCEGLGHRIAGYLSGEVGK